MGPSQRRHRNRYWTNLVVASLTQMALARPGLFLLIATAITILVTLYSALTLQFRTSRLDLLDTQAEYNQRWLRYLELFGKQDDGIILIEGDNPQRVAKALLDLGSTLEKDDRFSGVLFHSAVPQLANQRLHLASQTQLESLSQLLHTTLFAITPTSTTNQNANTSVNPSPTNTPDLIENSSYNERTDKKLTQPIFRPTLAPLIQQWNQLLQAQAIPLLAAELKAVDQYLSDPTLPLASGMWQPLIEATTDTSPTVENSLLLDDGGRLGLCLMSLHHPDDAPQQATSEQKALREQVSLFEERYPDLNFYLTGMPILEADEGQSTQSDMLLASVVSLIGVSVMLILAYGSLRMPLLAMLALLFGLLWTLSFATVAIGHLNLLSAAFGAILIGLGIDFSIHYLSHFLTLKQNETTTTDSIREQLLETSRHCGVGIWVGALSTAAAFGCAAATPFKGISELGVISGGGTLLCVIAALTILPASLLLYLTRSDRASQLHHRTTQHLEKQRSSRIAQGLAKLSDFAIAHPIALLITTTALLSLAVPIAYRSRFDHNLLNLQASGLNSVTAENILIDRSSHSTWYAVSVATGSQQAEELAIRFRKLPSVARVDHAASLIAPQNDPARKNLLSQLNLQTEMLLSMFRGGYAQYSDLNALRNWLDQSLPQLQGSPLAPICASLEQKLSRLTKTEVEQRIKTFETAKQTTTLQRLKDFKTLIDAPPPTIQHLPPSIRDRLWRDGNIFQLRIFPKGNVWDREPLQRFIRDLESVDPKVTGHPVQTFYASGELQESYYSASVYAIIVVSIILLLNFGNPFHVITAMLPAICSLISLLALMTWLDMPLNPANMIALPLVLGIGVDDGVHLTQQFRQRRHRSRHEIQEQRYLYTVEPGTNLAILLTSISTMLGFGSLMVAHHRGLFSLGWVLTIGIGLCWVFSMFLLPAIFSIVIRWTNRSRKWKRTRRARRVAMREL